MIVDTSKATASKLVMRADNDGEGGFLALITLTRTPSTRERIERCVAMSTDRHLQNAQADLVRMTQANR